MKKLFSVILAFTASFSICVIISSCNPNQHESTAQPGSWDKLTDFEGDPRSAAVSFVINGYAYLGSGYNPTSNALLSDFWRYNPANGFWERVSDFPGAPRQNAVAFALNGKGYVGTGTGSGFIALSDFFEFNPDINDPSTGTIGTWRKIADFPDKRYAAIAFTTKNRSFVGTGTNERGGNFSDLWEYDQINNQWKRRPSIIGSKRAFSFVMNINDYVYVGGGMDNGIIIPDFSRFDVNSVDNGQPWSAMNGLTGRDANGNAVSQPKPRALGSAFSIGNFGYLACGSYTSTAQSSSDVWQYDPSTDSWLQCFSFAANTPYAGVARNGAVAFTIASPSGTFGYISTGASGSLPLDDLWKFDPNGVEPNNK